MRASSTLSTRQKWMDLIRQHEQSGAAVKVFCRDRGVSEPSFYSWRKRPGRKPASAVRFGGDQRVSREGFFGSDTGGRTAAVLRSFVTSCELVKIDPSVWFRDVLSRIADHPMNRLDDLLPHR